jgi:hypothetical protein
VARREAVADLTNQIGRSRRACIGALYLAAYIAGALAPLTIVPLLLVGAALIFFGHVVTRIMFSATDEKEFYR